MADDHEKKYPSQLAERFQVRMPKGLRDRIRDAAEANGRAMNTEIVDRLEKSFDPLVDESEYRRIKTRAQALRIIGRLTQSALKKSDDKQMRQMADNLGMMLDEDDAENEAVNFTTPTDNSVPGLPQRGPLASEQDRAMDAIEAALKDGMTFAPSVPQEPKRPVRKKRK